MTTPEMQILVDILKIVTSMAASIEGMGNRVGSMEGRMESIENRMEGMENRIVSKITTRLEAKIEEEIGDLARFTKVGLDDHENRIVRLEKTY